MPLVDKGNKRNEPCPCGSGLKVKNCHGDAALKRDVSNIANGILMLFVAQRRIEKGLAPPEETTKIIDKLVGEIDALLPACATLGTNYEVKEEELIVDKLSEKEEEGACLESLQQDMVPCEGCGRKLPAGMMCFKCKNDKSKGSVYE